MTVSSTGAPRTVAGTPDWWEALGRLLEGPPALSDADFVAGSKPLLDGWAGRPSSSAGPPTGRRLELLDRWSHRLQEIGELEAAETAAELARAEAPGTPVPTARWAELRLERGADPATVQPVLAEALRTYPRALPLLVAQALVVEKLQGGAPAAEAWMRCASVDPTESRFPEAALRCRPGFPAAVRALVAAARGTRSASDLRAQLDLWAPAMDRAPELTLLRSDLSLEMHDAPGAKQGLDELRRAGGPPGRAAAWKCIAADLMAGESEPAIAETLKLVPEAPRDELAELERWANYWEASRPDLTVRLRHRIAELTPRNLANVDAWIRAASVGPDRAERILAAQARLALDAAHGPTWRLLAADREATGDLAGALEAYRAVATTAPAAEPLARGLALARAAGSSELVGDFTDRLNALPPASSAAEVQALREAGATDRARRDCDALLSQHPDDPALREERFRLVDPDGDPAESAAPVDWMYEHFPERPEVAEARARVYACRAQEAAPQSRERTEWAETALAAWNRLHALRSPTPESLREVARLDRLLHRDAEALDRYRELVRLPGAEQLEGIASEYARVLLAASAWSEVDDWLSPKIRAGASDPAIIWAEIEALGHLHRSEPALELLGPLLDAEPSNPLYLRRQGELLLEAGRRVEAMAVFRRAIQAAEGDPRTRWAIGDALRAQGAYVDAIAAYREGLALAPHDRLGRISLGEALLLSGQAAAAMATADDLLHEDSGQLRAWRLRADAARALDRPEELVYSLTALRRLDPTDRATLVEFARLKAAAGQSGEALEELAALEAPASPGPEWAQILLLQGELALGLGRAEEAQTALEQATRIDPSLRAAAALRLARARLRAGRPDLALVALEEGSVGEGSTDGWALRAEILTALERPAEARAAYTAWLTHDPKSTRAREGVARSLLDEGRAAEALDFLKTQIAQGSASEALYLLEAEAESGLGHPDAAVAIVEAGLAAFPDGAALWGRQGDLAYARDDWATAGRAYARALKGDPKNVDWLVRAATASQKLGRRTEGLAFLTSASEAAPDRASIWVALGTAYLAEHRAADALRSFDRAKSLDPASEAARDGVRLAESQLRDERVESLAREAALLEAKLGRPVTRNDLLVQLQVPLDALDGVMEYLGRVPTVDLRSLAPAEWEALEQASFQLIVAALERRPAGVERRGFTLADVAALSPPKTKLSDMQQLFGYVKAVLEADLGSDLPPPPVPVEPLVRRALELPPEQRTLFGLVRNLGIGLYLARILQRLEQTGSVSHSTIPALDLGRYSPEFQSGAAVPPAADGDRFFAPENPRPAPVAPGPPTNGPVRSALRSGPSSRCLGCGGLATAQHSCGAPVCAHCIQHFGTCPKCGARIALPSSRSDVPPAPSRPTPRSAKPDPPVSKPDPSTSDRAASTPRRAPSAPAAPPRAPTPRSRSAPEAPAPKPPTLPASAPKDGKPSGPAAGSPAAPPTKADRPPRPRSEARDDEPRL
ncbi:MAG: tetratricopeptide repeat protein [Thermoplasmata archaeon]